MLGTRTVAGRRGALLAAGTLALGALGAGISPALGQDVVELRWFCCLGTGEDPAAQLPVENQIVEDFNASHPGIHLSFEVVTYDAARDALSTQIASDNGPDVVGPVGIGGTSAFHGQWLDLGPLIAETGFDLAPYDPTALAMFETDDGRIGIPLDAYPSVLFYRTTLFDEIGLAYPPHTYGDPYVMPDGTELPWDYDTLREVAKLLTVDSSGNDATSTDFDASDIVQYGYEPQRDDLRGLGAYFGAGTLVGDDGGVEIPEPWAASWKYFYDSIWTDHITLTGPEFLSDEWAGQVDFAFFTGRVAMSTNFLWSTYGVAEGGDDWDVAAVPSYAGTTTSPLNIDTFSILKGSKHPTEAFEVVRYLLQDAEDQLLEIYAGMPAKPAEQDAFFTSYQEQFPQPVDWQVVEDSLSFADNPNWEAETPKYNETLNLLITTGDRWETTAGLDMDAEIAALEGEIQAIWDRG